MLIDFRERGGGREKHLREKHRLVAFPQTPPPALTETQTHKLVYSVMLQPTETPGQL